MPIKKKVPVKKAAVKKVVIGPKAKLMKLAVTTLRTKAKKLGVSDVTKRTKENLAQSILLGEARKKRGTLAGKKATAKRAVSPTRQKVEGLNMWKDKTSFAYRQTGTSNEARDERKKAKLPGKRTSASGNIYYERRRNRSDNPFRLHGPLAGRSKEERDYIEDIGNRIFEDYYSYDPGAFEFYDAFNEVIDQFAIYYKDQAQVVMDLGFWNWEDNELGIEVTNIGQVAYLALNELAGDVENYVNKKM
tara:strand:- start:555 stop:1295 length:741 start_codon:yes stop_codon:yes gene_type:complete